MVSEAHTDELLEVTATHLVARDVPLALCGERMALGIAPDDVRSEVARASHDADAGVPGGGEEGGHVCSN